jgi:hypothetical protein
MLTESEKRYCSEIADRVSRMREFLNKNVLVEPPEPTEWHSFLSTLRKIQGNLSNDGSFIATLLAKQYLCSKFDVEFDAAEKPQGAPGIDIDIETSEGHRIVAEIKTTVPYQVSDFGAQQAASFKKDFAKLAASEAKHKFLFVTDSGAFSALQKDKYTKLMPGVRIVHLATRQEHAA